MNCLGSRLSAGNAAADLDVARDADAAAAGQDASGAAKWAADFVPPGGGLGRLEIH